MLEQGYYHLMKLISVAVRDGLRYIEGESELVTVSISSRGCEVWKGTWFYHQCQRSSCGHA